MWALAIACALGAAAAPASAGPPPELPTVRVRFSAQGRGTPTRRATVAVFGIDFVWTTRGPPRARTRVPPALEGPWARELRRLEDPDLRPELEPLTPDDP